MKILSIDTCPREKYECEWRYRTSCKYGFFVHDTYCDPEHGHLLEPVPFMPVSERLAVKLIQLGLPLTGFKHPTCRTRGKCSNRLQNLRGLKCRNRGTVKYRNENIGHRLIEELRHWTS